MKIVNMVKLKEEFDYESLCRKLETQVDHLTAELEREKNLRECEKLDLEKQLKQCQVSFSESEKNLVTRSEVVVCPIFVYHFCFELMPRAGLVSLGLINQLIFRFICSDYCCIQVLILLYLIIS
jgi:hypothetical protein